MLHQQSHKTTCHKKKPKQISSQIKVSDQKILWGSASGRCSMPDCRKVLILDKRDGGSATLGAMCHIVADSPKGPRGKSPLSIEQRNSYANLILLCSHHHDIIDSDVVTYPVAVLHQIKTEHEQFAGRNFASAKPDPEEMVYVYLIDTIVSVLKLDKWLWFIDLANRDLLHEDSFEARGVLNKLLLGVIWPNKKLGLKKAIKELIEAFSKYVTYYESNCEPATSAGFFCPNRSYARYSNDQYDRYVKLENHWSNMCFWLLCKYIVKLNNFADVVRQYSNPMFFRVEGRFMIVDELGYRFDGRSSIFLPEAENVEKNLRRLQKQEVVLKPIMLHKARSRKRSVLVAKQTEKMTI